MSIPTDYITDDLNDMNQALNYNRWIIDLCRPWIGDKVLEVGAGTGNFTMALLEHTRSHITSLEPMPTPFSKLMELHDNQFKMGNREIEVQQKFTTDLEQTDHFDTVLYNNVMEHIKDDVEELQVAKGLSKPGGHVIVYSPALPFLMSPFDRSIGHFHRYTRKTITQKFDQAGLQVVHFQYVDFVGMFLWWLKFVVLRSMNIGSSNVRFFDRNLVPVIRYLESLIPIPLGKNVLCVGQKRG